MPSHNASDYEEGSIEFGIQAMREEITELKARDASQREDLHARNQTIRNLKKTIKCLLNQESDTSGSNEDDTLPDSFWDDSDCVERCAECNFEVVYGFCASCTMEHNYESDGDDDDPTQSISTYDDFVRSARHSSPRRSTPLLEAHENDTVPTSFSGTQEEYTALLERGATRLMISTFHLEYKYTTGIAAWADGPIYEAWAGPAMLKGDFWKIMLGRKIVLYADDLDGSVWLDEFLEDALLQIGDWETAEETPGVWVTRLSKEAIKDHAPNVGHDSSSMDVGMKKNEDEDMSTAEEHPNPIRLRDDYESDDGSEMDELIFEPAAFDTLDTDTEDEYDGSAAEGATMENNTGMEPNERPEDNSEGSDVPGSDWDSQEELSGDEAALTQKITFW